MWCCQLIGSLCDIHTSYYLLVLILFCLKVLCILWDMETEEVEDILQEFVNKSLLFCDRNGKSFHYYLHDLQLDFLTEKNRNQLQVGY